VRSSLSDEFDPILKSLGSPEISVLCPPVLGRVLGLPVRLRIAHWLTASSNSRHLRWPPSHPVSYGPALVACRHLFPQLEGSVGLPPVRSGGLPTVSRSRYVRTWVGRAGLVPGGWLSDSAGLLSLRGDCTHVVSLVRVVSTVSHCSGSAVSPSAVRCFLFLWILRGLFRESD